MAWIYKRPGSARWWLGWRVNGKQFFRSTGTEVRAEAEKKLQEVETLHQWKGRGMLTRDFIESLSGQSNTPRSVTVKSEMESWLTETRGSASPATLRRYCEIAAAFALHVSATEKGPMMADVDIETVRAFLVERRATKAASTANLWRTILSIFFGRAVRNGVIRSNPVAGVKMFKAGRDEVATRRAFTLEELRVLHEKAPDDFWRFMIVAGFFTGLRLGDLVTLKWGNVDFTANALRVQTRKTATPVFIPMRGPLRRILDDMAKRRGSKSAQAALWPAQAEEYEAHGASACSQAFTEILASCGLASKPANKKGTGKGRSAKRERGLSFHCLRHSFISTLAAVDGSKSTGMALAGHSSETVNDNYTHLPPEVLAAAIAKMPDFTLAVEGTVA